LTRADVAHALRDRWALIEVVIRLVPGFGLGV